MDAPTPKSPSSCDCRCPLSFLCLQCHPHPGPHRVHPSCPFPGESPRRATSPRSSPALGAAGSSARGPATRASPEMPLGRSEACALGGAGRGRRAHPGRWERWGRGQPAWRDLLSAGFEWKPRADSRGVTAPAWGLPLPTRACQTQKDRMHAAWPLSETAASQGGWRGKGRAGNCNVGTLFGSGCKQTAKKL